MDPIKAMDVFFFKWVLHAFELGNSNLQELLKFRLRNVELHKGRKWSPNLKWYVQINHKGAFGLAIWN
jgi:hypothetical protein